MAKSREGRSEIVISCGMDCILPDMPSADFIFAVLNTVLPSVTKLDIQEIHALSKLYNKSVALTSHNNSLSTSSITQTVVDGPRSPFSLLVRLSSGELVTKIFEEKKRFTSFSLANLNPSLLGESSIKNLKQTIIFINYYLKKDQYKEFTQLRAYAKTIGFQYGTIAKSFSPRWEMG